MVSWHLRQVSKLARVSVGQLAEWSGSQPGPVPVGVIGAACLSEVLHTGAAGAVSQFKSTT